MLCPELKRRKIVIELTTEVNLFDDIEEEFLADVSAVCDLDHKDILIAVWPEHKLVTLCIVAEDIDFTDVWNSIRFWFKPRRWEVLFNG